MDKINAIGRRKTSVARVYLSKGKGKITINSKDLKEYIPEVLLQNSVRKPLELIEGLTKYDVTVNVKGGGIRGQAEAIRLGIARALVKENADVKPVLKTENLLTRDARKVERKKFGKKKARKSPQFSKR